MKYRVVKYMDKYYPQVKTSWHVPWRTIRPGFGLILAYETFYGKDNKMDALWKLKEWILLRHKSKLPKEVVCYFESDEDVLREVE